MKLLDSNIIIYSAKEEYSYLRHIYKEDNVFISEITRLEVLGFHRILSDQENYFKSVFSVILHTTAGLPVHSGTRTTRAIPIPSITVPQAKLYPDSPMVLPSFASAVMMVPLRWVMF